MGEREEEAVLVRRGSPGGRPGGAQARQAEAGGGEEATQGKISQASLQLFASGTCKKTLMSSSAEPQELT